MVTLTDARLVAPPINLEGREIAEFERAMGKYKRRSGRTSHTWSEILEVVRGLGYAKPPVGSNRPGPLIVRVNPRGSTGRLIGEALARRRGLPSRARDEATYAFDFESDRAAALDAVRREFGWSTVDPL